MTNRPRHVPPPGGRDHVAHALKNSPKPRGRLPALEGLPQAVAEAAAIRGLAAGEPLFRQGDKATAVFEVLEGRLRLLRRTVDDHLVALHTARAGELFAEAALFSTVYHCDAVAAAPSRVRILPKSVLLGALRADPALFEAFSAQLARQLQALRTRLELRNVRAARERVLQYFMLAAGDGGRVIAVEGRLQDVAAELGLTREAFYRTLSALEADGVIARTPHGIVLQKSMAT